MIKFSIIIPGYKASFLKDAIESVLAQTYTELELIVVDDCSPHDLKTIVDSFRDPRLYYSRNEVNIGASNLVDNWNHCLSLCTGSHVICMGDDDMLLPHCLETYVQMINKYPNSNIYHGKTQVINESGEIIRMQESRPEKESGGEMIYNQFVYNRIQYMGDFCIKRQWLLDHGGYVRFPFALCSDWATANFAAAEGGIINGQKPMFVYRESSITISNTQDPRKGMESLMISRAWYLDLFKRINKADDDPYAPMLTNKVYDDYFRQMVIYFVQRDTERRGPFSALCYWTRKKQETSLSSVFIAGVIAIRFIKQLISAS